MHNADQAACHACNGSLQCALGRLLVRINATSEVKLALRRRGNGSRKLNDGHYNKNGCTMHQKKPLVFRAVLTESLNEA